MAKKWVYLFSEGDASMRDLLGGKGAGVAEMTRTGVPVPPGFTITTEACNNYYDNGKQFPEGLFDQVREAMKDVEKKTGKPLRQLFVETFLDPLAMRDSVPGPDVADPTIVRPGPGGGANTGTTPVTAIKNSDALANTVVSVLGLGLFGVLLVLAGAALRRKPAAPRVTA